MAKSLFAAAARSLYEARAARTAAKEALVAYRTAHGECVLRELRIDHQAGIGPTDCFKVNRYSFNAPSLPIEHWCEVCRNSQPLWEAYRAAATRQAAALRSFMAAGKRTASEVA